MIALATSSLQRFLAGAIDRHTDIVRAALASREATLPPVVVTEALSKPHLDVAMIELISSIDIVPIHPGFGEHAGRLRGELLAVKRKAKLADTLIAQSCTTTTSL